MKIAIIAVGKLKDGGMKDLFSDYAKRLRWKMTIKEIEIKKSDPAAQKQAECQAILESIPVTSKLIVCDERGKAPSSEEFAKQITLWEKDGVTFVIGGADGVDDAVRNRADLLLSFGRLTWPHQLVRVMLAEQIYRAQTILDGHPYHRV